MQQDVELWFLRKRHVEKSQVRYRLFLFPPAGGDVSTYLKWDERLPQNVETCFLKLPGRGMRICEPAIDNLEVLIEMLLKEIEKYNDKPFIFFGHSMGGLIAYNLAQKMSCNKMRLPERIIISSMKAPNFMDTFSESLTNNKEDKLYNKEDNEFFSRVKNLGGIPQTLMDNKEFMNLILPTFRCDMKLCETYDATTATKLDIPLDIYGGNRDIVAKKEELEGWRKYTTKNCSTTIFSGNHFYFLDNPNILLFQISSRLNDIYLADTV